MKLTDGEFNIGPLVTLVQRARSRIQAAEHEKKVILLQSIKSGKVSDDVVAIIEKNDDIIAKCTPEVEKLAQRLKEVNILLNKYN